MRSKARPKTSAAALTPPPQFIAPQLPASVKEIPDGGQWIHEIKHDGYRLQARIENHQVTLTTRGRQIMTQAFRRVAEELANLPVANAIIDGEIAAPRQDGTTHLFELRAAIAADKKSDRQKDFYFYAFDLLYLNGRSITDEPLLKRKEELKKLIDNKLPNVQYVAHIEQGGDTLMQTGKSLGIEGVVSKKKNSCYRSGRHNDWVKYKYRKNIRRNLAA